MHFITPPLPALVLDPFLELHQLDMKLGDLFSKFLALQFHDVLVVRAL
jgi:hypothetical protein